MKFIASALAIGGLLLCGVAARAQSPGWTPPGPAVGSTFAEPLALQDQSGQARTLKGLMGRNGVAVFFVRSADWCPFCKSQLVAVNKRLAEFTQLGLGVVSVSHDTPDKLVPFHASQNIGYTMLADPDGAVVEKMGIRDLQYADGSKAFGVARPMVFIIGPDMKIVRKYAEESYRDRPDLDRILLEAGMKPQAGH
jgi:peroxiredoxin